MKSKLIKVGIMIIFTALIIVSTLLLSGRMIGDKEETGRIRELSDGKSVIGFSVDAMVIERWQRDIDILKSRGEELGYHVEVTNAYEDSDKQIEQIRSLISEGAEAILILAHDKDALSDVVAEAKKEGVIVIAYDRLITNANVDAYVSFDNVAVGEFMAGAIIDEVPQGNYVIVNGSPSDNNSKMFNAGFYNELQPFIETGQIKVIQEVWADNWREDIAYGEINKLLQLDEHIDAIICANDLLAEGAISALSEYGLVGEIPVVGHDADVSACQRIIEGKQLMTVYKPLKNLAQGAADLADQLIRQKAVVIEETINDGEYDVPFVKFDVIPVDASNMRETIIADFFHTEEDVYRNSTDK